MANERTDLQVYKFGGASVKDAAAILNLKHIVETTVQGRPLLIVVSAMGKTTNALEEIYGLAYAGEDYDNQVKHLKDFHWLAAAGLSQEYATTRAGDTENLYDDLEEHFEELDQALVDISPRHDYDQQYDQIVSFGELLASRLVAFALNLYHKTTWLDCRPLIRTDRNWREGRVNWSVTEAALTKAVPPLLKAGPVVTQGFLGGTVRKATTTLGREGSDYSAAIFAYCLRAESVTIWKDVAGLLNADPKLFADTVRYPEISYQETIEMAYYGASVIHPKTLKPLADRHIPLRVKSFLDPAAAGTLIHDCQHPPLVPAFIRKGGQCLLSFESKDFAFISEENLEVIFGALAQARLKINLMQNSAISFSVCVDYAEARVQRLLVLLQGQFRTHYNADLTLFTIKNYDQASIEQLTSGRVLLLEQRTRSTFQFLVRE
ncbi:aspartate kinase [Hymenobacter sp. HMF4947]|uniref:Aspartokinase n=1 Tax=Hymenobacter ginkgonis TaxID=2682976 RepID=A0A7K1TAS1_9BACT|nr:aspartate kinase [Hymenobacter ginkgonis]MVN75507.1 aspartate kinase [Hymenobacter ginkgonis]